MYTIQEFESKTNKQGIILMFAALLLGSITFAATVKTEAPKPFPKTVVVDLGCKYIFDGTNTLVAGADKKYVIGGKDCK